MRIEMPQNVCDIIDTIENAGFEAYAVGGCIRDSILNRKPKDWDITTSAKPEEVKKLFRRTIDTGIQHGTVTVMIGDEGYEITTYRIDGEYLDGRHPKEVNFTASLAEDLKRRDFTMNALAYHPTRGLVDLFDGMKDMEDGVIRCVGVAKERFTEDALRIMRAIRFAGELGFSIDDETFEAMKCLAQNLEKVSAERIQVELIKLMVSPHPELFLTAYHAGITRVIIPEFDRCMETQQNNPHHCYNVGEHTMKAVCTVRADKVLRLSALLHDFGKAETKTTDEDGIDHFYNHAKISKEIARNILKRLKFDNDTLKSVTCLVEYHDFFFSQKENGMRKNMTKIGLNAFPAIFELKRADLAAQSDFERDKKEEILNQNIALYEKIISRGDPLTIKDLKVTGYDLMQEGVPKGKELGEKLNYLMNIVLDNPEKNEKEILLEIIKKQ